MRLNYVCAKVHRIKNNLHLHRNNSLYLNVRNIYIYLIIFGVLVQGCETPTIDAKERWGPFNPGELIKYEEIDYRDTPVYKQISDEKGLLPEYSYMEDVVVNRIGYMSDGLLVTGLMVQPTNGSSHPCIIFNRGGNREFGSLKVFTAVMAMAPLAAKGYIVIASNYRGNGGSEGQEEFGGSDVNDVLNLMPALAQIEHADTNRIGLFGISRGGMMTYLALKESDRFAGAVVWAGAANLFTIKDKRPEMEEGVFSELIPNYQTNADVELKKRSAVFWPEELSKNTPLLILHGTSDDRVFHEEAEELAGKLLALEHPFQFISYSGDNHGLKNHRKHAMHSVLNWMNKYLRDGEDFDEVEALVTVP